MATINFYQSNSTDNQKKYTYSDLHLDLAEEVLFAKNKKSKSDIVVDYDVKAIKNSITNLFATKKGQRPLEPDYGINLEQYLFEPVSTTLASLIGRDIQAELKFEPRVTPLSINVTVLSTKDGYNVDLVLYIPSLGINTIISANISKLNGNITIL